jgi:hypothetical protein
MPEQRTPSGAPGVLYLIAYTFDRDYFDSLPNVQRWLDDRGIEGAPRRQGAFAYTLRIRHCADPRRIPVEVAPGVTAVYGVPA